LNREVIAEILLERSGLKHTIHELDSFHTTHNYIDTDEMILRKGAIAAHSGERVLIPMNMRYGSLICSGKGNPDWNYSAPHGAGRILSRSEAKEKLTLEEFRASMNGIYTTCIDEGTLDESPMAYKDPSAILKYIGYTVDVLSQIKPVYNFKASEKGYEKIKGENEE
jgi:RNA-splicing ligase RtcB